MYPKYKYKKLVTKWFDYLIKELGIKAKVTIHIYKIASKKLKASFKTYDGDKGYSFISSTGEADVFLFYDTQNNERDALGTLVHELLHVRLYPLTSLLTMNMEKGHKREEDLVRQLEEFYLKALYRK